MGRALSEREGGLEGGGVVLRNLEEHARPE